MEEKFWKKKFLGGMNYPLWSAIKGVYPYQITY